MSIFSAILKMSLRPLQATLILLLNLLDKAPASMLRNYDELAAGLIAAEVAFITRMECESQITLFYFTANRLRVNKAGSTAVTI